MKQKIFLCLIFIIFLAVLFVLEKHDYLNFRTKPVQIVPKVVQQPLAEITPDISTEVNDLLKIVYALEYYKLDHWSYPLSSSGGTGWDGILSSNLGNPDEWIRGLAPNYIDSLPQNTRMAVDGTGQYKYRSNGVHYKLIVYRGDNCDLIKNIFPSLVDPIRDCSSYGFWTERAARW